MYDVYRVEMNAFIYNAWTRCVYFISGPDIHSVISDCDMRFKRRFGQSFDFHQGGRDFMDSVSAQRTGYKVEHAFNIIMPFEIEKLEKSQEKYRVGGKPE